MPRASLVAGATIAASLVVASSAVAAVIARGALTPLNGERATGKVTLTQSADGRRVLRFANSSIGAGPRLHVYLVPGTINGNADVKVFKDLGPLHGTSGRSRTRSRVASTSNASTPL